MPRFSFDKRNLGYDAPAPPSFPLKPNAAPAPEAPPAGSAASSLLKRYRPLETRATGGFGSVEICLDRRLQRRVAIKRTPLASPFNRTSAETTSMALGEARTASMLPHPNIVQVIDFTHDSGYAYLVMEYVDGMNLEEFLAQVEGHSLTYDEAACIADALVQALAFAHENGVLHLDIKPANVLIDRSGHVKLADFGMATLTTAAGFGDARGGTIGYMPPEQLGNDGVDARTDIFSLAAVLYESLCANAPFRAGTAADSLANIERGVIYPSSLLPDIPEPSEQALLQALSPDPRDRMDSVADFGDEFLGGLGNPREGRKSLARIIARLTSDDEGEADETQVVAGPVWELDPDEGHLGSRTPRARRYARAAVSGIAVAAVSWALLGDLGVVGVGARACTALGIGAAAAVAPQIGSALIVAGWLMLILNATPLFSVLGVAIVAFALLAAWWYVWGRVWPASSMAFSLVCALALLSGDAAFAAPIAVAAAAFFLPPGVAASTMGTGVAMAQLLLAAHANGGVLGFGATVEALANPALLAAVAGFSGMAALTSWALDRICAAREAGEGAGLTALLYALIPIASVGLRYLAHPMEIANLPLADIALAAGLGCLSSILVWICLYTLGYRRETPEGECS
ncbi:MAG: serine/threonine-protein kinase [Coriobacteriaceae bacterium]|nr:serine/threonine-protein kinase [Coriobacteriaceae bacterium]